MTIRKKIIAGFSILLVLIFALGVFSYWSVRKINKISRQEAETLTLDMFLDEKMGEHLEWMNHLADQFLLDAPFIDELDPHKCNLGKWYYSFKSDDPQIMEIHSELAQPHERLHKAGEKIKELYEPADLEIDHEMLTAKIAHLEWMIALRDSWQEAGQRFELPVDSTKCAFGKWYQAYQTDDPRIKPLLEKIKLPHKKLHASAVAIVNLADENGIITDPLKKQEVMRIFNEQCRPLAEEVIREFDKIEHIIHERVEKNLAARDVYVKEAQASAGEIQEKIGRMQKILMAKVKGLFGESLAVKRHAGRVMILLVSLFILTGGAVTFFISRAVYRPIEKLRNAVIELGRGNLNAQADVKSKDELGVLAACFNEMARDLAGSLEKEKELIVKTAEAEAEKKEAENLRVLNQQLTAKEQQLRASNQQLAAGEQQLKASNQQLRASEQQLRVSEEELKKKVSDLERFNKLTVGRELKMKELKARIKELEEEIRGVRGKG
ncbi:MAG: CZB domain-containing protein [Candidatus Omnitrophota bacterium]